jgi:hypothetical protein
MKTIIISLLGASTLFFSGCATVQRGTKMDIPVASSPSRAEVTLSTGQRGITPVTFTLKRNETVQVVISKEGYQTRYFTLSPKVSLAGVATGSMNLILGGVVGIGIDAISGANLDLSPNYVYATLTPNEGFVPDPETITRIIEGEVITGKQAKCCAAAAKDENRCAHVCCVDAAKTGDNCAKCGGFGKFTIIAKQN